jgi:hypothetical protein
MNRPPGLHTKSALSSGWVTTATPVLGMVFTGAEMLEIA